MKICSNGHLGQSKKCGVCSKPADMQFGQLVGPSATHPNGSLITTREIRSWHRARGKTLGVKSATAY